MAERTDTDTVRIDDFATPRFTLEVADALRAASELAPSCPLDADALMQAAVDGEQLTDFGDADDPDFRERVALVADAYRTEGGLSAFGTVSIHTQLSQLLVNRLRVTDLLSRHPEIDDIELEPPIIIAGLPRTGTTHLHNLLSADPSLRSLPYWESIEPVPPLAELDHRARPDPRRARTEMATAFVDDAMPYFKRMHEMTVDHSHEEIALLGIDFSTMFFETLALIPSWRDHYLSHDQTPHYEYLARVLRVCTWLRREEGLGTRWVLKSPQHLEQFDALRRVFPDATYVVTHRDPVNITTSMATMIAYTARLQVDRPDPVAIGAYWSDRVATMLDACERDRDRLPAAQSIDVRLEDLVRDDMAVVEQIYDRAAQPFDERPRRAMAAYLDAHPRGRHGRVAADAESLGIDVDERRRALRSYHERFVA